MSLDASFSGSTLVAQICERIKALTAGEIGSETVLDSGAVKESYLQKWRLLCASYLCLHLYLSVGAIHDLVILSRRGNLLRVCWLCGWRIFFTYLVTLQSWRHEYCHAYMSSRTRYLARDIQCNLT